MITTSELTAQLIRVSLTGVCLRDATGSNLDQSTTFYRYSLLGAKLFCPLLSSPHESIDREGGHKMTNNVLCDPTMEQGILSVDCGMVVG